MTLWSNDGSPSGLSQHTLRADDETLIVETVVTPDVNLWELFGQPVVVTGWFDGGATQPLMDGSGQARVFVATSIVAPEGSLIPATGDHALADSLPSKLAETVAQYVVPPAAESVGAGERSTLGEWGPVIDWPHVAVSAANLPDGRVLTFASNQPTRFPGGVEFTYAVTWDPATGDFLDVNHSSHDWIASDDGGELRLRSDDSVANASRIAPVPIGHALANGTNTGRSGGAYGNECVRRRPRLA